MSEPTADLAIRNLERLLARDPLLRDLVHPVLPSVKRQARFSPDVDVIETDAGWSILLDVPGVPLEALKVEIDGPRLHVSGERPGRPVGRAKVSERATGGFQRTFLLPFQVDQGSIRARLDRGVLTLTLPRAGGPEARRVVPVESGG